MVYFLSIIIFSTFYLPVKQWFVLKSSLAYLLQRQLVIYFKMFIGVNFLPFTMNLLTLLEIEVCVGCIQTRHCTECVVICFIFLFFHSLDNP